MLFLIEYDRTRGKIVAIQRFSDLQRATAENARFQLELKLNLLGKDHEIVILEAASEKALRRTHRRYFEDLKGLVKAS